MRQGGSLIMTSVFGYINMMMQSVYGCKVFNLTVKPIKPFELDLLD